MSTTGLRRRLWPVLRQVHAWVGIAACGFLAVIGLTGSLLVFEDAWLRVTVPGAADGPVRGIEATAQAARAAERHFGPRQVRSLVLASERFGLHEVRLADGGGAWLDTRTLGVVGRWHENGRAGEWLFALHHELLAGKTGKSVAGWIAVAALGLVITGVAYWARSGFRGARAWPRSSSRREVDAAHRTWGAAFAVPLAVLLGTGAALALPDVAKPLFAVVAGGESREVPVPVSPEPAGSIDWARALAHATARFPDARPRILLWPAGHSPPSVRLRREAEWHANGRTQMWFEPATGAVVGVLDALAQPAGARFYDLMWPVHASRVGGIAWQALAFLAGLALALLSITGAIGWVRARRDRPRPAAVGHEAPAAARRDQPA